jgi:hypothetical protein
MIEGMSFAVAMNLIHQNNDHSKQYKMTDDEFYQTASTGLKRDKNKVAKKGFSYT